jgi:hypothetical protein
MSVLIAHDDRQLRRLEKSIAAFRSRAPVEQGRMSFLLAALEQEKAAVLSSGGRAPRQQRPLNAHGGA